MKKEYGLKTYLVYTIKCDPPIQDNVVRVRRRYKWFVWLRNHLTKMYPALFIPPLPPKKLFVVTQSQMQERRKESLERWLNRLEVNRVFSESKALREFLIRPESTLKAAMKQCDANILTDDGEQAYAIQNIFPEIHKTPLPDTYQDDWVRLREVLESCRLQLTGMVKSLNELTTRTKITAEQLEKLVETLNILYDGETENPIAGLANTRPDVSEQLTAFAEYRKQEMENMLELHKHVTYEAEDIISALELVKKRDL